MKKLAALAVLTAGAVALPTLGFADEGTVRVRAGLAAVNYSSPVDTGVPDLESDYAALTLGGSYITQTGWFADLGLRTSLSAEWNSKDVFGGVKDDAFSRTETTFTAGKSLGDGLAVFGGLQLSKSKLTFSPANTVFSGDEDLTQEGKLWFVGVSKALPMGGGSLSLSGALGILKQETKWSSGFKSADPVAFADEKSDTGAGFSLGVAYSYPISKGLSVMGDLRGQSYSVKYSGESSKETVTSLGVSVVGQF
jgi:hypothetical protein